MGLTSLFHFDSIQFMNEFDNPDWNLAQVAAWVIYREAELVNQLADAASMILALSACTKLCGQIAAKYTEHLMT
jgi:hypothetical protein